MVAQTRTGGLVAVALLLGCGSSGGSSGDEAQSVPDPVIYLPFDGDTADHGPHKLQTSLPYSQNLQFRPGVRGKAAVFDGLGAAVRVEEFRTVNPHEEFTVELWFNHQRGGSFGGSLVSHGDTFHISLSETPRRTDRLEAHTHPPTTPRIALSATGVEPRRWHHVAYTFSVRKKRARLFADGELLEETAVTAPPRLRENNELTIGTWYKENESFAGLIDELRVFDVELSGSTITRRARAVSTFPEVSDWPDTREEWIRRSRARKNKNR